MADLPKRRLLVYGNRKQPSIYFDVSTPELEAGGFLELFRLLDEDWQMFEHLSEAPAEPKRPADHPEGCRCEKCLAFPEQSKAFKIEQADHKVENALYKKAKKGDALAAIQLLEKIKGGEYAEWDIAWADQTTGTPAADPTDGKPCNILFLNDSGVTRHEGHGHPMGLRHYPNVVAARKYMRERGYTLAEKVSIEEKWVGQLRSDDEKFDGKPIDSSVRVIERWEMKRCPRHRQWDTRFDAD
jgi:hypothetical protein